MEVQPGPILITSSASAGRIYEMATSSALRASRFGGQPCRTYMSA